MSSSSSSSSQSDISSESEEAESEKNALYPRGLTEEMPQKPYLDKFNEYYSKAKQAEKQEDPNKNEAMLVLVNNLQVEVLLSKDAYVAIQSPETRQANDNQALLSCLADKAKTRRQVVFTVTEPNPSTFCPQVSGLRLGTLNEVHYSQDNCF